MVKLPCLFQLNDWELRLFFVVILSVNLAFLGSIGSNTLGLSIPLLQPILGFLLLTFVPGILILRILRIHHLDAIKTTVYAAGLSLAVLMFTGFFMNVAYPLFGITRPLSLWSLIVTISTLVGILCFLVWIRDRDFVAPASVNFHEILSLPVLGLSLLPFGAVAGTYFMNLHGYDSLQMILLPVIALVPIVIIFTRFISERYYPYAVFSIAITLLYHTALMSPYIWGWDIHYEYYLTNIVIQNSFWDFTNYSNCNAMLSLMTLAPIYSILLGMGLEWVFKIIYPFFFALVPLGLYAVFQKQVPEKIAFLSCSFFMFFFVFYTEMLSLARQQIAELFFILVILSLVDRSLSGQQKSTLFLIFSASLVVSHYGLSYIFMIMLLLALAIAVAGHYVSIQKYVTVFLCEINERISLLRRFDLQAVYIKPSLISLRFVIWYGLFLLAWYIYMTSSSSFISGVTIAQRTLESISSDLFSTDAAQGMAIIVNDAATPLHEISKYLHLLTIFCIVVGFFVTVLTRHRGINFDTQYLLLSCGALGICIGGVVLPFFASSLNTSRLYQISLMLLAPFGVIGGVALISLLRDLPALRNRSLHIVAVFLGLFLLFNCGWFYEICQDEPTSIALNRSLDAPVFNKQEVLGSLWLVDEKDNRPVAADTYRQLLLSGFIGRPACRNIQTVISDGADYYSFIGWHNILHGHIAVSRIIGVTRSTEFIVVTSFHDKQNAIYSNGGSKIYCPKVL